MIVIVATYDPDYFKDNTFVFSDFETRSQGAAFTAVPGTQTQFVMTLATNNTTKALAVAYPNEIKTGFMPRAFDAAAIGAAEQWAGRIAGNYGVATTSLAQYPAQDNPVVRINITTFDLNDTNATNNSTTPVVG
ncbi:hypothetical protein pEaSNUABM5_00086 [Erwinia phage pEa_SNUABM_5]|uniref:Uncharacterized protein n=1 Tax=Erwinia phage pEa_SNUABM_5 TaxID=2797313 RepID=A0A7T8IVU2_9CAUD|nr:hypothetical protein MPK73_gp086 [Erwinia phage pEa_SNUABM_5]QQO90228.1 hypothetical protein pEaSNUABM5_00086 [Erwinia phage pEa_SNUABM_5]